MDDNEGFFDFLERTGKQIIAGVTEIELEKRELERLAELRALEEQARTVQQERFLGLTQPQQQQVVGFSSLGAVAMLTVALVLLVRG